MQKTGLKTFVYSFSLSLFAIFGVNSAYLHLQKQHPQIKISNKNITLFLKSSDIAPSTTAIPAKKIVLNALQDIKPIDDTSNEIIMADADIPTIPLEEDIAPIFSPSNFTLKEAEEKQIALREEAKPELIKNKKIKSLTPPAFNSEKISIPLEVPKSTSSLPKIVEKAEHPIEEIEEIKPNIVASSKDAPIPLLPLEKSTNLQYVQNIDVKIGDTSELNHIALTDRNISLSNMKQAGDVADIVPEKSTETKKWKTMQEQHPTSLSPWVIAEANGVSKNQKSIKSEVAKAIIDTPNTTTSEVKLAANTVQNLLIPIPEAILDEDELVPLLSVDPNQKDAETLVTSDAEKELFKVSEKAPKNEESTQILSSISSIFSKNKPSQKKTKQPDIIKSIKNKLTKSSATGKILPTEMRLSFQPNRAEISGQTLRWVQAFATNISKNNTSILEIRIDGTNSTALQQKRLNLLYNILNNKGVEEHKINTVFTQREPNSFVIRIVPIKRDASNSPANKIAATRYKQW